MRNHREKGRVWQTLHSPPYRTDQRSQTAHAWRFSRFSLWRLSLSLPPSSSSSPLTFTSSHRFTTLFLSFSHTPASPFSLSPSTPLFSLFPPPLPSGNFGCGPLRLYHTLSVHHGRRQKACRLDHWWSRYVLNPSSSFPAYLVHHFESHFELIIMLILILVIHRLHRSPSRTSHP